MITEALISNIVNNSKTLKTGTPTRVPNTIHQQVLLPIYYICIFNILHQHNLDPGMGLTREKTPGKSYFWKKSLIIGKKQTEKWSWRRLKKTEFWLKTEKSHACLDHKHHFELHQQKHLYTITNYKKTYTLPVTIYLSTRKIKQTNTSNSTFYHHIRRSLIIWIAS